jgi:hypothetical protein
VILKLLLEPTVYVIAVYIVRRTRPSLDTKLTPEDSEERRNLALANLAEVYNGLVDTKDGNVINVYDLIMATSDAVWSARNSTGDAMFLPGQFLSRFEAARLPEGNVYFAGEHLSHHHTWIAGALEGVMLFNPHLDRIPRAEPAAFTMLYGGIVVYTSVDMMYHISTFLDWVLLRQSATDWLRALGRPSRSPISGASAGTS